MVRSQVMMTKKMTLLLLLLQVNYIAFVNSQKNIFLNVEPPGGDPASKAKEPPSGGDSKPPGEKKDDDDDDDDAAPPSSSKIFIQLIHFLKKMISFRTS